MKIVVFGLGSIGQRHVRILQKLKPDLEIVAVQSRKRPLIIHDDLTVEEGDPADFYGIQSVAHSHGILQAGDVVFVTNPISMHVGATANALSKRCHVFIEKPLALNAAEARLLQPFARSAGVVVMVGYNLRFHPAIKAIKTILDNLTLGRLHRAKIHFGEYLPDMHSYEDYRATHMARSSEGGGVVRCLSHEVDLARYLFGEPTSICGYQGMTGILDVDVEDFLESVLLFQPAEGVFPVNLSLNFLDRPPQRSIEIQGDKGLVVWRYADPFLKIFDSAGGVRKLLFDSFVRNNMFWDQCSHFFDCISSGHSPESDFESAFKTTELCDRLLSLPKLSSKNSLSINPKYI